jgi:eukaryotic-like serine/threonine-protein kinase
VVNVAKPAIQTFGKYQILERIATGGMAEIYKARLEGIGGFQRTFAIKRILPNLSQNNDYISMLVDEAKVAGLLSHANIVQILDLGQVDGIWYIAMEYVHGRDLGAVLRRAKKKGLCLPVPHTVFIAIELLKGLEYAHQRQVMRGGRPVALNIIHRDVSPPNVLLSFQGEVKLTDFGIARASLKAMETVTGIVKGRFDYMSPEQAAGSKDLDQRSDLFSVGVVLYEMLTGHHPFRTDNEIGTIERVRTGRYVPVSQRNPEVPFTLETIVDRALQVNRDDRYPSATAFKEALDKFFHDSGFIFTHATLASYVRGLFPEATTRPGAASSGAGSSSTAPGSTTGKQNRPAVDAAEGPTRRVDRRKVIESLSAAPSRPDTRATELLDGSAVRTADEIAATKRRSAQIARSQDADDGDTLLRPPPDFDLEDEPATQVKLGANQAFREGASSDRRPGPSSGAPPPRPSAPARPAPGATDFDEVRPPTDSGTGSPELSASGRSASGRSHTSSGRRTGSGITASGRRRSPTSSGRSAFGWMAWLLSPLALVLGLAVGVLVTALAAGMWAQLGSSPPPQDSPMIEVVAPMGTQILLNGEAVPKSVAVEPDRLHTLEVTVRGFPPWTTNVKLSRGETRVYMIKAEELQPPPQ